MADLIPPSSEDQDVFGDVAVCTNTARILKWVKWAAAAGAIIAATYGIFTVQKRR